MMSITSNPWKYSVRELLRDADKQLAVALRSVALSLERIPDDYIPTWFLNMGCVAVASAFGAELAWGDHPDQTPGVREPLLHAPGDVASLRRPDPRRDGLLPEFLRRVRMFREATEGKVWLSCLDMNGPSGIASDLLGSNLYFSMMYDAPQELRWLLGFLADVVIDVTDAVIEAADGIDNLTSTDFFWEWCPEGRKGHVSDDLAATVSPAFFRSFTRPANSRIFSRYGGGLLHNCGPNPCAADYLDHDPPLAGVNLAYQYSIGDLAALRAPFSGRGLVYMDFAGSPAEAARRYREVMDILAPGVICIPQVSLAEGDDAQAHYAAMREVSRQYAQRVWGA
jgi:hypothetical protein